VDLLTMNLLTVNGLSKQFGAREVLRDVSFSVRRGEVLGLIGPNGAGKTTLFECLAGVLPSDGGVISRNKQALAPAQRKSALFYMPDGVTPWAQQSVNWALGFFERLYTAPVKAAELLNMLKLESLRNARIGTLSKGERKRLLLAMGLLTPQPLLMLDEPFDGLDLRQTRDVMALLRSQAERGRTLMLSIHQLVDAARVCDRLILLSDGRVVGEGTIDELRAQANLSDGGAPEAGLEEIFLALT
jgi:ABC-type multidrug transport system ATPase subunit